MRPGVLLLNFGGPQGPDELEPFLRRLFADVLPLPRALQPLLVPRIAASRARRVGPNYAEIGWSPLAPTTMSLASRLEDALGLPVAAGMMFTEPSIGRALAHLRDRGADAVVALGLFPHYSLSTAGSAYDMLHDALVAQGLRDLPVHYVPAWFDHPAYIRALAESIRVGVRETPGEGPVHLLFSPHGLPLSFVRRGDPYPEQIRESARRAVAELDWQGPWHLGWQSRVGPMKWLAPSTLQELDRLGAAGVQRVTIVPISFVGEGIETLHELDIEVADHARRAGIPHVGRAPALGGDAPFDTCLQTLAAEALEAFGLYRCVRCLVPKPEPHRRRKSCDNCRFETPRFLREAEHIDEPVALVTGSVERDAG